MLEEDDHFPLLLEEQAEKIKTARENVDKREISLLAGFKYRRQKKKLLAFYRRQAELVACYQEDSHFLGPRKYSDPDEDRRETSEEMQTRERRMDELLAKFTFGVNVVLLIAKTLAAVLSNSMSVISTVIDSAVDITSGGVIWLTMRLVQNRDPYEYPRGRERLEPIAVIIVSIIMGVANLVMIIQSVQSIVENTLDPRVDIVTVCVLITGSAIKIVLLVLCLRQKTSSSKVLAMDQRNDIVTNIVALAGAAIGSHLWIYADAIGAILVCSWIAGNWFYMAHDQIPLLSGKVAEPQFINRIIRIAMEHDERIRCLDAVMVYHHGNNLLVELHIVMAPEMTLKEAHDISEPLQMKLERLPYVERAFVHADYRLDGDWK